MSKRGSGSARSSRTSPMEVENTTFMVEKMGAECAPLQFVRELTQNAIDAVHELGDGHTGHVRWDVARHHYQLTGAYKLAIIDTGVGMTGVEMVKWIKRLFSSSREQSRYGNFGVGAKISALPRNPEGLMYFSWKDSQGYVAHLWRDPETMDYGLKKWTWADGTVEEWGYIEDAVKPDPITSHGTMVVLLGNSEDENTMQAPIGTPMPSRWILRYLNTRYFRFGDGVEVRAREGWERPEDDRHNFLREVHGQGPWLDRYSKHSGSVPLSTATAHWWILKENIDDDAGHVAGGGHVAALYQSELYEMVTARAGVARLQAFGIIFGCDRVVLYLEPKDTEDGKVEANTARTQLIRNGQVLPWADWATEFRENLPDRLRELMEEIGSKTVPDDHREAIRERLKRLKELFRFTRYRPSRGGKHLIDQNVLGSAGKVSGKGGGGEGGGGSGSGGVGGSRAGRAGDVYSLFLETRGGINAEEVGAPQEPETVWVTLMEGTRSPDDMEDRAAKYLPDRQNTLLINGDFRVFTDMVERWTKKYHHVPGAKAIITKVVQEWFEQQLIEAVMGAHALRQSGQWTLEDCKQLWSEEALTAAVLPRYHVDFAISRALGSRLGTLKDQASTALAKPNQNSDAKADVRATTAMKKK